MKKHNSVSLFSKIRSSVFTRFTSCILFLQLAFPFQAFATEEFFRQTKENFTPDPFIQHDLSNGAFEYTQPIMVPPGRNGLQPDIKLSYSSNKKDIDSLFGYGWSVNIPHIERLKAHLKGILHIYPELPVIVHSELGDIGGLHGALHFVKHGLR